MPGSIYCYIIQFLFVKRNLLFSKKNSFRRLSFGKWYISCIFQHILKTDIKKVALLPMPNDKSASIKVPAKVRPDNSATVSFCRTRFCLHTKISIPLGKRHWLLPTNEAIATGRWYNAFYSGFCPIFTYLWANIIVNIKCKQLSFKHKVDNDSAVYVVVVRIHIYGIWSIKHKTNGYRIQIKPHALVTEDWRKLIRNLLNYQERKFWTFWDNLVL